MLWKIIGVATYLVALVAIGVVASRRMRDVRDYYAGGKRFGFLAAAFSARATGESAWLLLGLTGMGAAVGVQAFWVVVGEVLGVAGAWLLMCGRFKRLTDRYDSITIPDYLERRFRDGGHRLRIAAAGSLVVFVTAYVSAQIDATGTAFESFLGMDYFVGALLGFAVVVAYTVTGGFVAVVWSDVFQGTLMFGGLVVLPIVGVVLAGGPSAVAEGLAAIDPALLELSGAGGWTLANVATIAGFAFIGLGFLGSPQVFVRFLAMSSPRQVRPGSIVAIVWTLLADSGAVLTGLVGRHLLTGPGDALVPSLGPAGQDVLPLLVDFALPAFAVGLFIAIVLAATMSTVDSLLVLASSAVVRDIHQKVRHPELADDALVRRGRVTTLVLAGLALAVAMVVAVTTPGRTIFWFVIFGWSGIAATFCPTMILSLFWTGFTARGAIVAMITGFICVPLFEFGATALPVVGPYFDSLGELGPAFAVSALMGVVVSRADVAGRAALSGVEHELEEAAGR